MLYIPDVTLDEIERAVAHKMRLHWREKRIKEYGRLDRQRLLMLEEHEQRKEELARLTSLEADGIPAEALRRMKRIRYEQ